MVRVGEMPLDFSSHGGKFSAGKMNMDSSTGVRQRNLRQRVWDPGRDDFLFGPVEEDGPRHKEACRS